MESLRQRLDNRTKEYKCLIALFDALREGSDFEATTLLARLRMGESLDDLSIPVSRHVLPSERPVEDYFHLTIHTVRIVDPNAG